MKNLKMPILVSIFIAAAFAVNVSGQDNNEKPMSKKALSVMIVEMKGVVSRFEKDETKSKEIARRWDNRKDLEGKSKAKVIELLYEDVREVIYDPQKLYQINSIFATYIEMPDCAFEPKDSPDKCEDTRK